MRIFSCLFLCLTTALTLTACGFQPLYGKKTTHASPSHQNAHDIGIEDHLALTEIAIIPNREGQFLRNQLIDSFHHQGAPLNPVYRLTIAPIKESITDLNITATADSTRAQIRLTTQIILTDNTTNEELFSRKIRSITSYNILASEFATRVSEASTREDALTDLSRQIETQLGLYFRGL